MSTSNAPKPASAQPPDLTPDLPNGLPSADVMSEWANDYFKTLPSQASQALSSPTGLSLAPTSPQTEDFVTESVPSRNAHGAAVGNSYFNSEPNLPHTGNFESVVNESSRYYPTAGNLPLPPGFSFLNEARSLFSPLGADISLPQFQGAPPTKFEDFDLEFLKQAKSLEPSTGSPTLSIPSEFESQLPANLTAAPFDVEAIRRDFPILDQRINGHRLIWLDNAATTQKPSAVIDRLSDFYRRENSNIHRAAHELAARATDAYEAAREKVRGFLGAGSTKEIIFVRGATEGINLVAQTWGRRNVQKDDEIVITWLEHHANIVPWQMLCSEKGAHLRVAPVDSTGQIILEEYEKLLNPRTRLVAFPQVSNALGTITPLEPMIAAAHRHGARVLLDGAQAVSHMPVNVQQYDCDFYVFSGHKVFAPTGIGVVFGKADVLDSTPPWHGGGNMITDVTFEKTQYQVPPGRFEAGTGSIADAVGLGAAIDYIQRIGLANIARHDHDLLLYATRLLTQIPGLRLIGTAPEKAGVMSFVLDNHRTEDIGFALNRVGIAVRAGHHCAQPILRRFGVEATVRPSLALYNSYDDIDALCNALWTLVGGHHSQMI